MNTLDIHPVKNEKELQLVHHIRTEVFVHEQDVSPQEEFDGWDDTATHFITYYQKKPVGCARIRFNDCVKLERIAIRKPYRRRGFGMHLTQFLIQYAHSYSPSRICIHAQLQVRSFYKKCGFQEEGEVFLEAGIKHIVMVQPNHS